MLPATAADRAPTFFQSIDFVSANYRRRPGAICCFRMLRAITLLERRHRGLRLLNRYSRFQSSDATHKTETAHQSILRRVRIIKRRGDKDFGITTEPRDWKVRQNSNNRGGDAVQCNAAAECGRIGIEALAPETFRDQGDVVPHFLLLKEVAAGNRMNA